MNSSSLGRPSAKLGEDWGPRLVLGMPEAAVALKGFDSDYREPEYPASRVHDVAASGVSRMRPKARAVCPCAIGGSYQRTKGQNKHNERTTGVPACLLGLTRSLVSFQVILGHY